MFARLLVLAASASLTLGLTIPAPAPILPRALPSGTVTCGPNKYVASGLTKAINAGVKYLNGGNLQNNYPHQYYQYADEHITLWCSGSGPWYEFPIFSDGSLYTSSKSSPGADRVIFTGSGTYCATVTHYGQSNNAFTQCAND